MDHERAPTDGANQEVPVMKRARWFRWSLNILVPVLLLGFGLGAKKKNAPVRATMEDGQILYGAIQTRKLTLESPLGELKIPIADIGEVLPVEGDDLSEAGGHVRLWLRDGSELVGKWQEPTLAMTIEVGKEDVKIDLPADQLGRMQTQSGEVWPRGAVYRVRTVHGDDFLVDARDSRFTLANDLGEFSPTLADCRSVRPVDDPEGDWRVELATGTVLIGEVKGSQLTLAMPLGPDTVTVPLASFESMNQQSWATADQGRGRRDGGQVLQITGGARKASAAPEASWEEWEDAAGAPSPADQMAPVEYDDDLAGAEGWFQRHSLERAKQSAR